MSEDDGEGWGERGKKANCEEFETDEVSEKEGWMVKYHGKPMD